MYKKNKIIALSILLIAVLGFAVYANSFKGQFLWDDELLVEDNVYIKNFRHIKEIFTRDIGEGAGSQFNFFRPLQMLTYMFDYRLYKLNVIGYHITNTFLHILVALAVYFVVHRLFKDSFLSLVASLFFVAHPVHTEAVAYISGRADLLAALFMLLSFIFYLKSFCSKDKINYFFILFFYACALLSRENSLILPLLVFVWHYAFRIKLNLGRFLQLAGLAFIYIVLRLTLLDFLLSDSASSSSFVQRIPGFFAALATYLRLLVLPFGLHMEYGDRLFSWSDMQVLAGILFFLLLLAYFFKRRQSPLVSFSISWFFVSLLPQANLYPINSYMAEHWLYLPSIGFFLILANIFTRFLGLPRFQRFQRLFLVLFFSFIVFYSFLTIKQNTYWLKPELFYKRTLSYAPFSSRVHNNLGAIYREEGRNNESVGLLERAVSLRPDYHDAYNNLGIAYYHLGRIDQAVSAFNKAIEIKPSRAEVYNNLGNVYRETGRLDQALPLYKKAIEINPYYPKAYYNLGLTYNALDKKEDAMASFKKVIELNPDYVYAYNNLANLYKELGDNQKAILLYKKAIDINPEHARAHSNLAIAYYDAKEYALAIRHCDIAIELGYEVSPKLLELLKPYRGR